MSAALIFVHVSCSYLIFIFTIIIIIHSTDPYFTSVVFTEVWYLLIQIRTYIELLIVSR